MMLDLIYHTQPSSKVQHNIDPSMSSHLMREAADILSVAPYSEEEEDDMDNITYVYFI